MVTNNFKKLLFELLLNVDYDTSSYLRPMSNITFKNTSNTQITWVNQNMTNNESAIKSTIKRLNTPVTNDSLYGVNIKVGTGTTAPTANDYNLESVSSDIVCDSIVFGFTSNNTKSYTATFSNPTANDIQVKEMGLYAGLAAYVGSSTTNEYVLLDRTVLSTPITIPAGQSKSITYEISF